jgi:hypothetical protein
MVQLEPGHCSSATLRHPHRTATLRRGASWTVASPRRVESSPAERGAGGDHLDNVYGIDLAIRGVLARHPVRYALANPLALASVFLPPVRVIFSLRLARSMFRRGHLAASCWSRRCWCSTAQSSYTGLEQQRNGQWR